MGECLKGGREAPNKKGGWGERGRRDYNRLRGMKPALRGGSKGESSGNAAGERGKEEVLMHRDILKGRRKCFWAKIN